MLTRLTSLRSAAVRASSRRTMATAAVSSRQHRAAARTEANAAWEWELIVRLLCCWSLHLQAPKTKLLINGELVDSKTSQWIPVKNPVSCCASADCDDSRQASLGEKQSGNQLGLG